MWHWFPYIYIYEVLHILLIPTMCLIAQTVCIECVPNQWTHWHFSLVISSSYIRFIHSCVFHLTFSRSPGLLIPSAFYHCNQLEHHLNYCRLTLQLSSLSEWNAELAWSLSQCLITSERGNILKFGELSLCLCSLTGSWRGCWRCPTILRS